MTAAVPTPPPEFKRIGDMIRAKAQALGDKPAVRFGDRTTTYAELDRRSNQVAHGLRHADLGRGDRVLYLGKNSDHFVEIYLGAAKIGAVVTPLNWRLAPPELAEVIQDSGGRLLFVEDEFIGTARGIEPFAGDGGVMHAFTHDRDGDYERWRDSFIDLDDNWPVSSHDPVIQLYTSGTTGTPKGVVGDHRAMLVFRALPDRAQPEWNRWSEDDVSLLVSPQFHIAGSGQILQTLCAGATGVIMREFDVDRVLDLIANERLSRIYVVPAVLKALLEHPAARTTDYGRVRSVIYGSSPIPSDTLRTAMAVFGCNFIQQYGMTEILGVLTVLDPEDHRRGEDALLRSAGRALDGVELAIRGPEGHLLQAGEIGEIVARTPTLMQGYWRKPAESAAVMAPGGWYLTGDAGFLDPRGYLFIQDRIKDMIVSGGENVYPAEVENALSGHPAVREVAVIGVPDARWGEAVKAVVVLHPDRALEAAELMAWARPLIAGYKLPKSVEFRAELPRNGVGKVLKRALRDAYWQGHDRNVQ